ncbi:SDR family oxidoreductase [Kineosporia mesophila]|uniref:SDR family oxidoreductase n=1 Tax=Kineosporia mesophila TaxID=566012 RepID=A0ABP6YYZ6_9ACTN|nr:NAD-dependent epimerase/dehydratase family protein [Kineosporia mesophila]MCD5351017.1 NAD-dependent epimerase/dehydratase family protein [Kineosporia mesophila]
MSDTTVVLGAGSGLGGEIARQLVDQERHVRGVTRSGAGIPDGAENHRADLLDRSAAIAACRGASVIHLATNVPYPDWVGLFPVMVDNAIAAAQESGAKLVFADNLYCYGPVDGPFDEQTPERPVGPKEKLRSRLGHMLLDAHAQGRARVTLGRSSDYYGPGSRTSLPDELIIGPLARGRNPFWFAPRDVPHTFAYSADTARALIVLGDDDRADGRIWHTPAAPTLPVSEFAALAGEVAGTSRRLLRLPGVTPRLISLFDRRLRGYAELDHQRTRPWIVDHSAFERTFASFRVTPHTQALKHTVDWYRTQR